MKKKILFSVIVAGIFTAFSIKGYTVSKPNIIFIMADDMGINDVGCYGQKLIHTPNIDKMASEGMMFTQHYAGSTVCAPSRCTLMTGKHTGHGYIKGNFAMDNEGNLPIPAETVTVAEILKSNGPCHGNL